MKLFKVLEFSNSVQVLNEKGQTVGELLFGFINGLNDRIKIGNEFYKIKNTGFGWMEISVYDLSGKLVLKTDSSKDRIFYYGTYTEIYTYQYKGWMSNKKYLYDNNDKLLVILDCKQRFFRTTYSVEIDDDFNNYLIILSFLNFYLRGLSSG